MSSTIEADLVSNGFAIASGLSQESVNQLLPHLGTIYPHRDSDANGVTEIQHVESRAGLAGFAGFSNDRLELHTDRSSAASPPDLLIMFCRLPATVGGYLQIVDGRRLFDRIQKRDLALLKRLLSTQCVFQADDRSLFASSIFEVLPTGRMGVRFRLDGKGFFCNQDWGIIAEFLGHAHAVAESFRLEKGQLAIIDNRRCLHGRTAFLGARNMIRVLLRAGAGLKPGFEAPAPSCPTEATFTA
jgi:hypothetical protein